MIAKHWHTLSHAVIVINAGEVHTLKNTMDTLAGNQSPAVTPANINAASVTSFSGVALDTLAVYSAGNTGRITGLGAEDIIIDESGSGGDGALSVHDANLLDTYNASYDGIIPDVHTLVNRIINKVTGTEMGAPVSKASIPLTNPSVPLIATALTR